MRESLSAGGSFRVLALALSAAAGSGCGMLHHHPPAPPPVVIMEPPIVLPSPPPSSLPMPREMAIAGDPAPAWLTSIKPEIGAAPRYRRRPERLGPARQNPPQPGSANMVPNDSLRLSQSLSLAQQSDYRNAALAVLRQTQADLDVLYTRNLNNTAAATRAQAAEYVEQARQALQVGDLVRARTLAGKAQTLTRFLLGQ